MVEIIDDAAGLSDFHAEWSQFATSVPDATPFQMPDWLATWWSHLGSGALRTMVFREHGDLTGVLPLFLHEWQERRQLTLLGSGVSDYLDPLFNRERIPEIVREIRVCLNAWTDWDLCDWQDLGHNTPLSAFGETVEDTPCSAVSLPASFEKFLNQRPPDLKRNLRRYRAKSIEIGPAIFEVSDSADPALLDVLVALHEKRWQRAGEPGMIQSNRSEAFVRDVAARFAGTGSLFILTLRFGKTPVAVILALRAGATIFGYLSAFDPDYEKLGVGRELLARSLRYAHQHGYRRWDFLRGEEPYKFSWGAQRIPKRRVRIFR